MRLPMAGRFHILVFASLIATGLLGAAGFQISGRVVDEIGIPVEGAQITLTSDKLREPLWIGTDAVGRFILATTPGTYSLKVMKQGFYSHTSPNQVFGAADSSLEITLVHVREFDETVSVSDSTPEIDHNEVVSQTTLTSKEIIDIPAFASPDFRGALPMVPGIIRDSAGRIHVGGGGENQALYQLDGFNLTSPAAGILRNRISVDAIRSVRVETSRLGAEYGKGSAGVLALESASGDDHFRFSATDFLPSYEFHNGLTLSNWTPRATFSGPIRRGRIWYFNSLDLRYDLNIVDALPRTANTNRNWFGSDLLRVQTKVSERNNLTVGILYNFQNSRHYGLTPLDPAETSRYRRELFSFFNIKDQIYFAGGWGLEAGFAINNIVESELPLGGAPYRISTEGRSGNYFLRSRREVRRMQWIANLFAPSQTWHGRHLLKFGIDANEIRFDQVANRSPLEILRYQGTRAVRVTFEGAPAYGRKNAEFSGYVQDHWMVRERVSLEAGMRVDWDEILRKPVISPRLAASWSPGRTSNTKLSAGAGVFYDSTNLFYLSRGLGQGRSDTFYAADGETVIGGPMQSSYIADERSLRTPFYLNWSLGWEQKLPANFHLRMNYMHKAGHRGWAHDFISPLTGQDVSSGRFELGNSRRDRYQYVEWTLNRTFADRYPWMLSYVRSAASSTAVLDFTQEIPIFARQASGPLDWDAPNRLISWALLPLPTFLHIRKVNLAYFGEWHTGFPFSSVNERQSLIGSPNGRRFPDYLSLNIHLERRFKVWRHQWALRAGFNNITGRNNVVAVLNNIDSPRYGSFYGGQGRAFTGRIRFLGKN